MLVKLDFDLAEGIAACVLMSFPQGVEDGGWGEVRHISVLPKFSLSTATLQY